MNEPCRVLARGTPVRVCICLALVSVGSTTNEPKQIRARDYRGWKACGGGSESIRYSSLARINRQNVKRLQVAWTYDTEDEMQCNPIIVGGVVYVTSPRLRAIALDAATGRLLWSFDPFNGQSAHTIHA